MRKILKFGFTIIPAAIVAWLFSSYMFFGWPLTEIFQKNGDFYQKIDNEFLKNNSACYAIADNYLRTVTCDDPMTHLPELDENAKYMKFILSDLSNKDIYLRIFYAKDVNGVKSFPSYDFKIHDGMNTIKLPEPFPWRLDIEGANSGDFFLLTDLAFSSFLDIPVSFYFVLGFFAVILFVLIFFYRKIKYTIRSLFTYLCGCNFYEKICLCPSQIEKSLMSEFEGFLLFIKNNKSVVFWVIIGGIATFGVQIAFYTVSIDFELWLNHENNPIYSWYYGTGRSTMGIIQLILMYSGFISPWLSEFFAAVLFIFSALAFSAAFYFQNSNIGKFNLISFSIILFSLPLYVSEFFVFNTHNIFICFGFFFLSLSVYFLSLYFKSKRKLSFLLASIFLLLAIMTYQSFVQASVVAIALLCVYSALENESSFSSFIKKVLTAFIIFCIALVFSYLINKLFLIFYPSTGFVESVININNIFIVDKGFAAFSSIYNHFASVFKLKYFGGPLLKVSLMLTIFLSVFVLFTQKVTWKRIVLPSLILFMFFGGLLHLLVSFSVPARSYQALIISNAGIWFLAISILSKWRISKWAICFISFLLMTYQVQVINRVFYGNHLRYIADERNAEMIMSRIIQVTGQKQPNLPIMIYGNDCSGSVSNLWKQAEVVGGSYFCFFGEMQRPINFINILGYNIKGGPLPKDKYNLTEDMPAWPHDKSIKYLDDMIIIKLGELK